MRSLILAIGLFSIGASAQTNLRTYSEVKFQGHTDDHGNTWGEATFRANAERVPVVQGAPFSAEERETYRVADNAPVGQLVPPTRGPYKLFRDAQGRTRLEHTMFPPASGPLGHAPKPPVIVEIYDPVDGFYYLLDPEKKRTYRVKYTPQSPGESAAGPAPLPPLKSATTTEPLGTKQIGGLLATGERFTQTLPSIPPFPPGFAPNSGPPPATAPPTIMIREEWWYRQPPLNLLLLRTQESRTTNVTLELDHLSLANPKPEEFLPPKGWKVTDEPDTFTMQFGKERSQSRGSFGGGFIR